MRSASSGQLEESPANVLLLVKAGLGGSKTRTRPCISSQSAVQSQSTQRIEKIVSAILQLMRSKDMAEFKKLQRID